MNDAPLTILMNRAESDAAARGDLLRVIEPEMRRIARFQIGRDHGDPLLESAALVSEVFLRLYGKPPADEAGVARYWNDRAHFFRWVAVAMWNLRVDHARRRRKQLGELLSDVTAPSSDALRELEQADLELALDRELQALAGEDEEAARVFTLRFAGLPMERGTATGRLLPVSEAARQLGWKRLEVDRAWRRAVRYLRARLPKLGVVDQEKE